MASKNEAKIVFKAVTDQFKSAIDQAKGTIGGLNAQLRLNSQEMAKGGNTTQLLSQRVDLLSSREREQQAVVENLGHKLEAARFAYGENSTEVQKLNNQLVNSRATLQSYANQTEQARQKLAQSKTAYGQTSQAIKQQEGELKRLKQEYANAVMEEGRYSASARELKSKIKELSNELGQNKEKLQLADDAADRLGNSYMTAAEKSEALKAATEKAGRGLQTAGTAMSATVTPAVMAAGGAAVKMSMDFEQALAKVSTIADTSQVPMDEMREAILALSDDTGIAAGEIAENVYNAISAGQETGDAVRFVGDSARLAKSGFAESGAALDVLTTTLNAYNMESERSGHVSDVLITTQNKGKTTVGELSAQMGKAIPTASAFKVSLENLAAAYATTTAKGIATAESTTYINGMINELGDTGSVVGGIVKDKLGMSFAEAMESGTSLGDALSAVQQSADESGKTMFDLFGSAEAAKAAFAIAGEGADGFNANLQAMNDSAGATDEAFAKMDTTSLKAEKSVNRVKNAAIDLGTELLDALGPSIDGAGEAIEEATEWFEGLDEASKRNIISAAGMAAAAGPVIVVLGKLVSSTQSIITVAGKARTAYGDVTRTLDSMSKGHGAAAKAAGALEIGIKGVTKAAGGLALAGLIDEASKLAYSMTDANKEALASVGALASAGDGMTSFGERVAAAKSIVDDTSAALTASGSTIGEVSGAIRENEGAITGIIATALAEQRGLREEDLQAIRDYNAQIEQLQTEKVEAYRSGMQGIADSAAAEGRIAADRAAELLATAEAYHADSLADLDQYHSSKLQSLNEQFSIEHSMSEDEYKAAIAAENDYYSQSKANLDQSASDARAAVAQHAEATARLSTDTLATLGEAREKFDGLMRANFGLFEAYLNSDVGSVEEATQRMADALKSLATDGNSAFLGLQLDLAESSGEITSGNAQMIDTLLSQFEGLPPEVGDAGDKAMRALAEGLDGKLGIDVASSTAEEIVGAYRSKVGEANVVGGDMGAAYAAGLSDQAKAAVDAALSVSGMTIDKFAETASAAGIEGDAATIAFAAAIADGAPLAEAAATANASSSTGGFGTVDGQTPGAKGGSDFAGGIGSTAGLANAQASLVAQSGVAGLGSVDAAPTGSTMGGQFSGGIGSRGGDARTAGSGLASQAESGARSVDGSGAGDNFALGFIGAIGSWAQSAFDAAFGFVSSALAGGNAAQQSRSPAKKTKEMAKWNALGFIDELGEREEDAYRAGFSFVSESIAGGAAASGIAGIGDASPFRRSEADHVPAAESLMDGISNSSVSNSIATTYNVYINDAKINDMPAVRAATKDYLMELHERGTM